jgi:16S rRNA (uracil1498-N3)-methyltransferase
LPVEAAPSFILVHELPEPGGRLTLPEDESHYLVRVCRVRPGERVSATDGRGGLAILRMLEGGRNAALEVDACERATPQRTAWVLAGSPEGTRGDWVVEKLAELGVAVFQPVDCERGGWEGMKGRQDRWQRLAAAALRQSRRRFLMQIRAPEPLEAAIDALPEGSPGWLADATGPVASRIAAPRDGLAVGLIGPAAGLAARERGLVSARGFRPIALSDGRLRAETAALAWACWWSAGEGESRPLGP